MKEDIENFIENFNDAWTLGKVEQIIPLIHNRVIFLSPDFKTEIKGKENCLQSLKNYINMASTKIFDVVDKKINIWNQTAIVNLDYYVEYEMNNQNYKEKGTEFWTLINENDGWQLIWRALVMNEKIE